MEFVVVEVKLQVVFLQIIRDFSWLETFLMVSDGSMVDRTTHRCSELLSPSLGL